MDSSATHPHDDCIFCAIVQGRAPAHTIWEDDHHLAFLSIFPNTPGFSVVVTKQHRPSDVFALEDDAVSGLMLAAKAVARRLNAAFDDVGRTGCMVEGFGVDHAHVKLFPMHGTTGEWRRVKSNVDRYFERYEGYISSHDYRRAADNELAALAAHIRKAGA